MWGGGLVAAELPGAGNVARSTYSAAVLDRERGRAHGWEPIATTFRDGLLAAVAR